MIDVMIITFNESLNLPHCLAALKGWTNRIFVIDSGSTDGTPDIARSYGATVVHHDWEGYARQKNWALQNLPFETPWLLIVDADEIITEELRARLLEIDARPIEGVRENGFFINRLTYFMDRPIRHCGYFPSWNLRFFKRGMGLYENREVHEHIIIQDPVGYIDEPMLHNDRRGLEHYMAKHNRYSTLEARALLLESQRPGGGDDSANLAGPTRRRRWLKRYVMPHVPMPGLWRFLYMYILRLGVLDGAAGLEFCKFISVYDYMVALKYRALRRQVRAGQVALPGVKAMNALSVSEGADSVQKSPALEIRERIAAAERPATPVPGPHIRAGALVQSNPSDTSRHSPEDFTVAEPRTAVSIVVLTMNEDINIRECLASCAWSDDVHVLDSGSTDNTISLSREWGAKTHFNPFKSFGEQRNWAIDNIPLKHDWVFHLDADERFTPALVRTIKRLVESGPPDAGYYVPNKLMFMDRWLRRSGGYPTYQMRLFHRKRMRFCDYGHGQRELTNGTVGTINEPYLHYAFSKGLTEWFAKHNGYSTLEALQVLDGADRPSTFGDLFRGDRIKRRRAWKELSYKMPLRPWLRLIVMLFLFGGVFEGKAGRTYARMMATYEHMISLKLRLLRTNPAAAKVEMAADPRMMQRPSNAAQNGQTSPEATAVAVQATA